MHLYNDADKIRYDQTASDQTATRALVPGPRGAVSVVAATKVISTYPTTAGAFYGCQTQTVLGTETEGGAGTLTGNSDTFLGLNLGSAIPPAGTAVVCTFVAHRWCFRYDG